MEAGGWTLVFKLIAGISGGPAKIWRTPFSTYEYSLAALNTKNDFKHHYKNRIVQNWSLFKPSEAKVALYKSDKEEVVLRFNAANSNNVNWFSAANVLESPWQDILSTKKNYFTVGGPCYPTGCRDFHINSVYGGCAADDGWLSIGDSATCKWEKRFPAGVKLTYSKATNHVNYNTFSKVRAADVFAVFIR
ncbi:Hypothetical predicted protein [Paramuricea clavata]|uniref:Uncharacterized protein n=1 Tax=Paramuricea clavata TaxID=317549 RepID=A0A7D9DMM3_PARCT|nr:Hypothetical predicted protein [Paramuricea clavata]